MYLGEENVVGNNPATRGGEPIVPGERLTLVPLELFACRHIFLFEFYNDVIAPLVRMIFSGCRAEGLRHELTSVTHNEKVLILHNRCCNLRLFLDVKTHGEKSCTQFILARDSVSVRRE